MLVVTLSKNAIFRSFSTNFGAFHFAVDSSYLESQDLWLDEGKRLSIHANQTLPFSAVSDSGGRLFLSKALDALRGRHVGGCCLFKREMSRMSF